MAKPCEIFSLKARIVWSVLNKSYFLSEGGRVEYVPPFNVGGTYQTDKIKAESYEILSWGMR